MKLLWKLILIWNVNCLMLLILVFSVFELKYLLEMCNLTFNSEWFIVWKIFCILKWESSAQKIYIYFFSYQPITTATSTNMNPWNENIYLYLKKAYLPAWKLNVDYKSFKKKNICMLLNFNLKKNCTRIFNKNIAKHFGFFRKMTFSNFEGNSIFLCNLNFDPWPVSL